jgi:hypothetical protein
MQWKYSQWNNVLYVQNVTHGTTLGERCVAIHFDQSALNDSIHLFDLSKPDWYAAQVPTQATPAEVFGKTIVTTDFCAPMLDFHSRPTSNFFF